MSDWRFQSRARELLASCRDNPPARQMITTRADEWFDHTDQRVRELKRIYLKSAPPIDTVEYRAWASMNWEDAIRDVIEQSKKDLAA
jgi:hypothetical protein